ncbi:serine hydrolase [Amycolatopsis pigmentata]|uniref:Serine hydrolase n=1 Tax=Amycolatopsis pigmentata TaxID=450801 RepID=A0ABW5FRD3_9PSEU
MILLVVFSSTGASAIAGQQQSWAGRFDRPQPGFAPTSTTLREAQPDKVGLDPAPILDAERFLSNWTRDDPVTGHPHFSGAVGLLVHDGAIVDRYAVGGAVRYADAAGTELPPDRQVPMRDDTIFDLASITKLFTSIAVMQLVEEGSADLDAPVARYLPEFAAEGKQDVTLRQLLTHTSGLDADPVPPLWQGYPDIPARRQAVLHSALKNSPGSTYLYSDINLMTLGFLIEHLTGKTLDQVVREKITTPLGMADTGFNPPATKLDRIAATEDEASPPRGMLRGQVHDENAWALGGVAGHAGIFSTAGDLALLSQAILNGGAYRGARILCPETVQQMISDNNTAHPGQAHGLGFELDQMFYMGGLSSPATAGHTGFTGTSLVIDFRSRSIAVLLTNRVHPTRAWGSINLAREKWSTALARALAVRPVRGADAWFSTIGDDSTATLTTRSLNPHGPLTVRFAAFVETEASDPLVVEMNTGGDWRPLPVRALGPGAPEGAVTELSGHGHRAWWNVTVEVPAATQVILRWRYRTDSRYTGRGLCVDGVRVTSYNALLVDSERDPSSLSAIAWTLRSR